MTTNPPAGPETTIGAGETAGVVPAGGGEAPSVGSTAADAPLVEVVSAGESVVEGPGLAAARVVAVVDGVPGGAGAEGAGAPRQAASTPAMTVRRRRLVTCTGSACQVAHRVASDRSPARAGYGATVRLGLMTEPQLGGTYDDLLFAARRAERAGLESFARSDHYYWSRQEGLATTDALTTLGGLARETKRIRLCVLVSPITFRHPAVLAKSAASIDEMSDGRFDLGLGSGWMTEEHTAFGLPFPPLKERFERLEEALRYLRASFSGASFEGRHYQTRADSRPRPTGLRIIVGGSGPEKTPILAGRFADEYNHFLVSPVQLRPKIERMREAAAAHDRDPAAVTVSVMGPALFAPDRRRLDELLEAAADFRGIGVSELLERWHRSGVPMGSPDDVREQFAAFAEVGVGKYHLQWLHLTDRDGLAEQVDLAGEYLS